jgi:hypothetical protein
MLHWTTERKIKNLPQLLERVRMGGGSIIQYDHVISLGVITQRDSYFEWVGPGASRRVAGLKHAALCLVLGWWSPAGLFWAPIAVAFDLMGGLNVTERLLPVDGIRVVGGVMQAEGQVHQRVSKLIVCVTGACLVALTVYLVKTT